MALKFELSEMTQGSLEHSNFHWE